MNYILYLVIIALIICLILCSLKPRVTVTELEEINAAQAKKVRDAYDIFLKEVNKFSGSVSIRDNREHIQFSKSRSSAKLTIYHFGKTKEY